MNILPRYQLNVTWFVRPRYILTDMDASQSFLLKNISRKLFSNSSEFPIIYQYLNFIPLGLLLHENTFVFIVIDKL